MQEESRVKPEMYKAFANFWIHQDRLMWSRVTWALTIEIALVTGSFSKPGILGCLVLAIGTVILAALWGLLRKDLLDQKAALNIIDQFHEESGFPFPKARILSEPKHPWGSGKRLITTIAVVTLTMNAFLFAANLLYLIGCGPVCTFIDGMF
jgi:hypothetical protein